MGWTHYNGRGRAVVDILKQDVVGGHAAWLDHEEVGTTVYALLEKRPDHPGFGPDTTYIPDPDGTYRFIAVFLTTGSGHAFGYKDMVEGMGPYCWGCPRRLIERASPLAQTEWSGWAKTWRDNCLKQAA